MSGQFPTPRMYPPLPIITSPDARLLTPVSTKKDKFWEELEKDGLVTTSRARVPGGWLVQQTFIAPMNRDLSQIGNMQFVSDPDHLWSIESKFN